MNCEKKSLDDKIYIKDLIKNRDYWEDKQKNYYNENIGLINETKRELNEIKNKNAQISFLKDTFEKDIDNISMINAELKMSKERIKFLEKQNTELREKNEKLEIYKSNFNQILEMNPNIMDDLRKYEEQQLARKKYYSN